MTRRPPDAGTSNQWTLVGDARVVALADDKGQDYILIQQDAKTPSPRGPSIMLTLWQAQALAQVLPAVVAHLERKGD